MSDEIEVAKEVVREVQTQPFVYSIGPDSWLVVPDLVYTNDTDIDRDRSRISVHWADARDTETNIPEGLLRITDRGVAIDTHRGGVINTVSNVGKVNKTSLRQQEWGYVVVAGDGDGCIINYGSMKGIRVTRRNNFFVDCVKQDGDEYALRNGLIHRFIGHSVYRNGAPADGFSVLYAGNYFLIRNNQAQSGQLRDVSVSPLGRAIAGGPAVRKVVQQPAVTEAGPSSLQKTKLVETPKKDGTELRLGFRIIDGRAGQDRVYREHCNNGTWVFMVNDGAGEAGIEYAREVKDRIVRKLGDISATLIDRVSTKDIVRIANEIQISLSNDRSHLGIGVSTCDALIVLPGGRKIVLHVGEGNSKVVSPDDIDRLSLDALLQNDFDPHRYGERIRDGIGSKAKAFGAIIATPEAKEIPSDAVVVLGSDGLWEGLASDRRDISMQDLQLLRSYLKNGQFAHASNHLSSLARRAWEKKERDYRQKGEQWDGIDDISVCVVG